MSRVVPIAALVLLAGCGWFERSTSSPAVSVGESARARSAARDALPTGSSPLPQDSADLIDRVVAVVNQEAITLLELLDAVAYHVYETGQHLPTDGERAMKEQVLKRMVEQRLELQEAERDKIVVEDAEVTEQLADLMKRAGVKSQQELEQAVVAQGLTMATIKKRLRDQIMVQKVIRRKVALRISVTEDEIERYYLENRSKLEVGLSFHARHILIVPEPPAGQSEWETARLRAEEVWSLVLAGNDFAQLARKYSQDSTAAEGGDLGVMKQGELAPDIEAKVLRLRPGEACAPFRSQLGYHLFKLEWRETLTGEALAQTKQQIRDILFRGKYQARLEAWIEEIKQRAIVEIRL